MGRSRHSLYIAAPDLPRLAEFVAATFEWTARPADGGATVRLSRQGEPLMTAITSSEKAIPGMLVGFHVDDVERAAEHAERMGARIGRRFSEGETSFVMLVGSTGEPFAIEQASAAARSTPTTEAPLELWTRDCDAAASFYTGLLGWSVEARGRAQVFCSESVPVASIGQLDDAFDDLAFQRAIGRVHHNAHRTISHWMPYCPVRNLDDVLDRCRFFGGRVVVAPTDLPVGARTALVRDPQGAHVGLREV
jgi:uncharacterized protein